MEREEGADQVDEAGDEPAPRAPEPVGGDADEPVGGVVPRRGIGAPRHRGILVAGICVVAVFAAALTFALFSASGPQAAVPGTDAIASLAAVPTGFLVGTTGGLVRSPDGTSWSVARLPREVVAVASTTTTAYALAGGQLHETTNLTTFTTVASGVAGNVIAAVPGGGVDVVNGRRITQVSSSGRVTTLPLSTSQPANLLALAVSPVSPSTLYAGGPESGLWRTQDGGVTWQHLDQIPVQALLIDPANPERLFVGTVGGVFVSGDGGSSWATTGLRNDVNGLAASGGRIFAIGADRVLYVSANGVSGWASVSSQHG